MEPQQTRPLSGCEQPAVRRHGSCLPAWPPSRGRGAVARVLAARTGPVRPRARSPACRVLSAAPGSPPSSSAGLRSCARGCGSLPTLASSCVVYPSPGR